MTETLKHMFLFCSHAEFIWNTTSIDWDGLKKYRYSFWHWRNSMMKVQNRKEGRSHIALTVNILWQIWKSRNQVQFNEVRNCPGRTASKAVNELSEYQEVRYGEVKVAEQGKTQVAESSKWVPPPQGFIKLNTDVALEVKDGRIGWGVVARREDGRVVGAWAGGERRNGIPAVEEALAIRKAIIKARQYRWHKVEIQSDSKQMVDKLKDRNVDDPVAGTILNDVMTLCQGFSECYFSFC
ncbi:uncharacterized protein [Coffea arabica]|uniref:RNase H type-1 domain-containing protein n=1 Tax=Coffea arabica TaxID=13443 RepID=A0A6P6UKE4_COFAR|nr:uncharacterized protein LOC113711239 [Coffea arabica]